MKTENFERKILHRMRTLDGENFKGRSGNDWHSLEAREDVADAHLS